MFWMLGCWGNWKKPVKLGRCYSPSTTLTVKFAMVFDNFSGEGEKGFLKTPKLMLNTWPNHMLIFTPSTGPFGHLQASVFKKSGKANSSKFLLVPTLLHSGICFFLLKINFVQLLCWSAAAPSAFWWKRQRDDGGMSCLGLTPCCTPNHIYLRPNKSSLLQQGEICINTFPMKSIG